MTDCRWIYRYKEEEEEGEQRRASEQCAWEDRQKNGTLRYVPEEKENYKFSLILLAWTIMHISNF